MNPRHLLSNRKLAAGAVLVAALLALGFWPSAVAVDTLPVTRGTLRVTVDEEGETRVRDRFVVSAPVAGRVLRIELEPGDAVRRGQTVVATFRPAAAVPLDARARAEAEASVAAGRAAVGRARAERARAASALALARSALERNRVLAGQQIVSSLALEARETEARTAEEALHAADFEVTAAERQLEMLRARLLPVTEGGAERSFEIHSPIDGVVLKRHRESESVVPAGEPLVELGDPANLEIVSDLLSAEAVKVRPGAPAHIEQWGGDGPLRGRVRRVEPSGFMKVSALGVEEQRVNVVIDFEDPLEAWRALGDAYRVEVRIEVWQGRDVLKLPTSSLFRRGDEWAVFSVEDGHARLRVVEIGRRNSLEVELRAGLTPGTAVVLHPSDRLEDGARVSRRAS